VATTETYTVAGMTCDHCVHAVTSEVGALPGVSDVRVNLETGAVTVRSDEPLSLPSVRGAVEEAGYSLAS
jgi:copper ion binding protein